VIAKRLLKNALVAGAYHTGLLGLYLGRKLKGRAVALTYHRVLPEQELARSFSTDAIVVTPQTFRRHCKHSGDRSIRSPPSSSRLPWPAANGPSGPVS
jgi:hypothetical protein